jgi:hypothetical protein
VVRYLAARLPWGRLGGSVELLETFLENVDGYSDTHRDWTDLHDLIDRWEDFEFLPPIETEHLRCHHSLLKAGTPEEIVALLIKISSEGIVPQPKTAGASSELPGAVFAVADDGTGVRGLYSRNAPYVTFDLPVTEFPWTHFRGYHPGNVVVTGAIPTELVVGINGVPVKDFLTGVRRWIRANRGRENPSFTSKRLALRARR